jgi:hypothetical protein
MSKIMTDSATPVDVAEQFPHIKFNDRTYCFSCAGCGEKLQLNKTVLDRFYKENAMPLIQSIVDRDVNPWLNEHKECGDERSFPG